MSTSIPTLRYPLACFRRQAEKKLTALAKARLEDSCAEDRAYAAILLAFMRTIDSAYLPYPIVKMRAYSQFLSRAGNFDDCPDEEVPEGTDLYPISDIYLEPYRDAR